METPPVDPAVVSAAAHEACPSLLAKFIASLPKAELHVHLEGTLQPSDVFRIAEKNERLHLVKHDTVETAEKARVFTDLLTFLDELRAACEVLMTADDFEAVLLSYLRRAAEDGVVYAEVQFGPQEHTTRGVSLNEMLKGLNSAIAKSIAEEGPKCTLIIDLLKDAPLAESDACLKEVLALPGGPAAHNIVAIGLAAAELGQPPAKFAGLMSQARAAGLRVISHAGEEGGPEYVRETIEHLGASRIDHGVQALHDPSLCALLREKGIGLCVCPLSNWKLKIYQRFFGHVNPIKQLLDAGVHVSISSDDPAFFGGGMNVNFERATADCGLTVEEIAKLAQAGFEQAFGLSDEEKAHWIGTIDAALKAASAPAPVSEEA